MELYWVIALVAVVVVGFFGYQWWASGARKAAAKKPAGLEGSVSSTAAIAAAPVPPSVTEGKLPEVAGQTEAELRAKEPVQRPAAPPARVPALPEEQGPAEFETNLRHPEQAFHQPTGPIPSLQVSDVPAGRAGPMSTPGEGHAQAFAPEMAQNGGPIVGNNVFAFDGMEPTGYAAF